LKLADQYKGNTDINGQDYNVEENGDARPFCALLDVGLARTSTGARVFGALKGITDAGVEVPHSESRFVGYDEESSKLNADTLKKYIYGGHVGDYMKKMSEENADKYKAHFSRYIKAGIKADGLEAAWKKVHAAIRADPSFKKSTKGRPKDLKKRRERFNNAQRKDRVRQKLATITKKRNQTEQ